MGTAIQERKYAIHLYRLTIFLSAFLLFWVQLLLAKYILPWFGGASAVWITCMLFSQVLLLGGYTYAHILSTRLSPRAQSTLHSALMAISLVFLIILMNRWTSAVTPGASWKPDNVDHPVSSILTILSVSAGVPYFVLSSTGPLLQSWFRRVHQGDSPYRLYALSNLGSLLALLGYPTLVEPWLTLRVQGRIWSWAYIGFALVCGCCAFQVAGTKSSQARLYLDTADEVLDSSGSANAIRPQPRIYAVWLSLAALPSVLFLATTNQLCQDIAVVPFLWVLPLSLYLLSFIICFEKKAWYSRRLFHPAFALAIFLACFLLYEGASGRIFAQVAIYSLVLFACCMVCHGELFRLRPNPRFLTSFYLMVAGGGAAGGIFVGLIAPHLFKGLWEYQLGLWGLTGLLLALLACDKSSWLYRSRLGSPLFLVLGAVLLPECVGLMTRAKPSLFDLVFLAAVVLIPSLLIGTKDTGSDKARQRVTPAFCVVAWLIVGAVLFGSARAQLRNSVRVSRNFYGTLTVRELNSAEPEHRAYTLNHGRIIHGVQFRAEAQRRLPTAYYEPASGIGMALVRLPRRSAARSSERNLRIGVVGLGIGTLAAYGQPGDYIRFYELNPEVIRIATQSGYFTFLKDCAARTEVVAGDARLSMESELRQNKPQHFDLLAIDAFAGDAIPVHLLTEEAFAIYLEQLNQPSGILALHITNGYFDLRPEIFVMAERFGMRSSWIHSKGDTTVGGGNDWILLSRDGRFLDSLSRANAGLSQYTHAALARPWTDDYSNLLQVLKR